MEIRPKKTFTLTGPDGKPYQSETRGTLGGYRGPNYPWLYGRLDCKSALAHIKKGGYVRWRVFFANEATALAAGHRPCGNCMRKEYALWKATAQGRRP
jgi:hypothetical protein